MLFLVPPLGFSRIRCGSIERRGRCTITASHDPDQGLLYALVVASVVWAASKKQGRKLSLITIRSIRTLKGAGTPLCGAHELNVKRSLCKMVSSHEHFFRVL